MKVRASVVILAALVALMAASGASARHIHAKSNVKPAAHVLKKAQKHANLRMHRRAGRQVL